MRTPLRSLWTSALLGCVALAAPLQLPPSALAAEHIVYMTDLFEFEPSRLEIEVGDTVYWINLDDTFVHTSTSVDGYWDTGDIDTGDGVGLTFPVEGTFPYRCNYFYQVGMTGTIVVKPGVRPPPESGTLSEPSRLTDGRFRFTLSGLVLGSTNIIQGSTDLANWTNLHTNIATTTSITFEDADTTGIPRRFYRVWHR